MIQNLFVVCVLSLILDVAHPLSAAAQPGKAATPRQAVDGSDGGPAAVGKRFALVVGNGDYAAQPLRTPLQDARNMTELLESVGFETITLENASGEQISRALDNLDSRLGADGVGLFYFAGHGIQMKNNSYLLPSDARTDSPHSVRQSAIEFGEITRRLSSGRPQQPKLFIIDACLTNPFAATAADGEHQAELPAGLSQTLIAFATSPGRPAFDGSGNNSVYTSELIRVMSEPGLSAADIFTRVHRAVSLKTGQHQNPQLASSLSRPFYLQPAADTSPPERLWTPQPLSETTVLSMQTRGILPKDGEAQYELEFWQSIKDSTDAADYEAYLEAYPDGKFAPLARSRAARYEKSAPAEPKAPATALETDLIITDMDVDYVVTRTANIRQEPSANSKRLGELKQGSTVHVTGRVSGRNWYQVKSATGVMGFVFGDLLKKPAAKPKASPSPLPRTEPTTATAPSAEPPKTTTAVVPPGNAIRDCPSCPEMLVVPAGSFTMGDNQGDRSEKPAHRVSINRPFAIGKYEVTTGQWNECVKAGACSYKAAGTDAAANSPVRDISWNDTQEYLRWLSQITKQQYRLPTEAEWEYAARAGTKTRYWWGNTVGSGHANCKDCGGQWDRKKPAEVDDFPPNPFGLYGTNGGVWEWVSDCWHKSYEGAPKDGSSWNKPDCRENVIRGGSWRNDASYIHSASRFKYDSGVRYLLNGFRVARTLE